MAAIYFAACFVRLLFELCLPKQCISKSCPSNWDGGTSDGPDVLELTGKQLSGLACTRNPLCTTGLWCTSILKCLLTVYEFSSFGFKTSLHLSGFNKVAIYELFMKTLHKLLHREPVLLGRSSYWLTQPPEKKKQAGLAILLRWGFWKTFGLHSHSLWSPPLTEQSLSTFWMRSVRHLRHFSCLV